MGTYTFIACVILCNFALGLVKVNFAQIASCAVPFGGYKQSGIGRELGQNAIDTWVPFCGSSSLLTYFHA